MRAPAHQPFAGLESELLIEAVSIEGPQHEKEPVPSPVVYDRVYKPGADAPAPVGFGDNDIGEIAEGGVVGYDPGEADLLI